MSQDEKDQRNVKAKQTKAEKMTCMTDAGKAEQNTRAKFNG